MAVRGIMDAKHAFEGLPAAADLDAWRLVIVRPV
jgi:hypothetical protein